MATAGPRFPGTATTELLLPEDDNDWLNPTNIGADDGSEASITAATYDAGDVSTILRAYNFGFSIPAGSTIDGITVEIERRDGGIGAASDHRVQLFSDIVADAASFVGANKAATATDWPVAATIATYGGVADTWTASPTVAMVNGANFGVGLSVDADAANTDIFVDFIRMTITYTPPAAPTSPGGLHHISSGMGDTGEGARVPQTLHTIDHGIAA